MIPAYWFWWILVMVTLAWYVIIAVVVAYKGTQDLTGMISRLSGRSSPRQGPS